MATVSLFDPSFKLEQCPALAKAGLSSIDISISDSAPINWDQHAIHAQQAHEALNAQKLACGIVYSNIGIDDIDVVVKSIEVAHAMGSEFITVKAPAYSSDVDHRSALADLRACFQDLNQLSSETGVDALITIDAQSICPNADSIMRVLEGLDPSQVGVLFDPSTSTDQADCLLSIDVFGPFLRALAAKPGDKDAIAQCLAAIANTDELLISVTSDDPKAALSVV